MHRTLIDTTDMASPETRAQGVNLRPRALFQVRHCRRSFDDQ
jgi:hypothetical protein